MRSNLFMEMRALPSGSKNKLLSIIFAEMEGCEKAGANYDTDRFFQLIKDEAIANKEGEQNE